MQKDGVRALPLGFLGAEAVCPCFIAYMNIWYKLHLQQSPSAPRSVEGDAGWCLHFCIQLHLGQLQHSSQETKQAEIC